ncbi:hypothetical protein K2173_022721 [Erythroxylum novogranatense]|uniref:Reverse transcriptase zinc-binding domain-containing protein n=1 Tax=Erythroxylum novogranatense TaxID=1862640 RepID=A0AAV8TRS0_9ROSI|nr:hypothetical protein K2173_022721 [Erythroxylum novogranatense]
MPPKLKNFMWRAMRGILPTCCKLVQRHLNISVDCDHCGEAKDIDHALLFCEEAQLLGVRWGGGSNVRVGVRYDRIWVAKWYCSFALYRMELSYINDWQQANMNQPIPACTVEGSGVVEGLGDEAQLDWLCFVDGAIFVEKCLYSYGVVRHDREGNFVRALSSHFVGWCSPDVVEAMALWEALTWVLPLCHGRGAFYSYA